MEISIVYCSDDNFVNVLLTSMESLIENNTKNRLNIYLINNEISEQGIFRIRSKETKNVKIQIISFPDFTNFFSTSIKYDAQHLSISTYGRLFISELLPNYVDKVIYLDCDTIICGDLAELYNYSLGEKVLAGVDDCKSKKYRWVLGLEKSANYINAGVLLIDLNRWREFECEKKLVNYIQVHNGNIHFEDQGAINATLNEQIKILPLKYNVMTHLFDLTYEELLQFRKPVIRYQLEEIEKAKENPIIIHYTSSFLTNGRAWHCNTDHKKREVFWSYMKKAEISAPTVYVPTGKKKLLYCMKKFLPRKLLLMIAIIMHEYIEPIRYYRAMKSGVIS